MDDGWTLGTFFKRALPHDSYKLVLHESVGKTVAAVVMLQPPNYIKTPHLGQLHLLPTPRPHPAYKHAYLCRRHSFAWKTLLLSAKYCISFAVDRCKVHLNLWVLPFKVIKKTLSQLGMLKLKVNAIYHFIATCSWEAEFVVPEDRAGILHKLSRACKQDPHD